MNEPRADGFSPRPFHAARWLPGAHAQTIGGKLLRPSPRMTLRRERWDTPDGDFLDLDFAWGDDGADPEAPIVLVLHGLEGSARRPYMLLTYEELARRGARAVGLNFRGCGGEPNRAPRFYHSGDTADARLVLERLRERWPRAPLGAIGFSLGGNVLLKLLGEMGEDGRGMVATAAAISVPYDLAAGADALERGPAGRLYTFYFLRSLRQKVRAKADLMAGHCDVAAVMAARTMREWDDALTAPLHGFADADDYYERSAARGYVASIRVPTLLIQAMDDPFQPEAALPRDAIAANPALTEAFTPEGGHVGFVAGAPWAPGFWAEEEAARWVGGGSG